MKKYLGLLVGLALLCPALAGAAQFSNGDVINLGGVHPGERIGENVYAVGGTVSVVDVIDGDLYVAGGTVNLTGEVTKDVTVVSGTLVVSGKIGGDLRVAGGNVTVGGSIGEELAVVGGNVNVLPNATVGSEAYIAGGVINLSGLFPADLVVAGDQITLEEGFQARSNFDYYSQKEAKISDGAIILGKTNFHQQEQKGQPGKKAPWAFIGVWALLMLAATLILSWIIFYGWRKESANMIDRAFARPGWELLRGFLMLIAIPIAAIILLITVVGMPIGFFLLLSYIPLLILAGAASGILAAALLARFAFKRKETELNWWLIALAVVLVALIKWIPYIGWIFGFLLFLWALGTLGKELYEKLAPGR